MHYVYILHCSDNNIYIGCTKNIKDRLLRHKKGNVPATAKRIPVKLTCCFCFTDKIKAFNFEKYLKSGSGRSFIKRHF